MLPGGQPCVSFDDEHPAGRDSRGGGPQDPLSPHVAVGVQELGGDEVEGTGGEGRREVVLLASSLAMLVVINFLERWSKANVG